MVELILLFIAGIIIGALIAWWTRKESLDRLEQQAYKRGSDDAFRIVKENCDG